MIIRGLNARPLLTLLLASLSFAAPLFAGASVYNFTLPSIDGEPTSLSSYKGKVILLVNVASRCGFTPQYSALESLYEKYKDQGFVILGFPANNFGAQEPGTNAEIKSFCTLKYNVTFPIFPWTPGHGIICPFTWPQAEAIMMFSRKDDHFHPGIMNSFSPLICIKSIGIKNRGVRFAITPFPVGKCVHAKMSKGNKL